VSPFLVCALAAVVAVNTSPRRGEVRAALRAWERPISALVLIMSGALLALPTLWIIAAVPALQALRIGARWLSARYARVALTLRDLPPHVGLGTVAQDGNGAGARGQLFPHVWSGARESGRRAAAGERGPRGPRGPRGEPSADGRGAAVLTTIVLRVNSSRGNLG